MKCTRCKEPAEVKLRAHNSAFCRACFVFFFQRRVVRAIEHERMFDRTSRILVAVSGGKDSLALWDVLVSLGYATTGLYLGLGIGSYSDRSREKVEAFAAARSLPLTVIALADEESDVAAWLRFRVHLLSVERSALADARNDGSIDNSVKLAIDRELDYATLFASARLFHRHVLGARESAELYRTYVQCASESPGMKNTSTMNSVPSTNSSSDRGVRSTPGRSCTVFDPAIASRRLSAKT